MDLEEEEKVFSSSRSRRPDRKKKTQNLFLSTDVYKKLTLWGLAGLTIYPDSALIYLYLIRIIESDDDQTRPEI